MRTALNVLIALLVAAHLLFFVLEAVIWETDSAARSREALGFVQEDQSEVAKVGKNQGLCNAFLAAGIAWGLWAYRGGKPEGKPVLRFFLGFIAIAGVVGWLTIRPEPRAAAAFLVGQTGLALAALACLLWQADVRPPRS